MHNFLLWKIFALSRSILFGRRHWFHREMLHNRHREPEWTLTPILNWKRDNLRLSCVSIISKALLGCPSLLFALWYWSEKLDRMHGRGFAPIALSSFEWNLKTPSHLVETHWIRFCNSESDRMTHLYAWFASKLISRTNWRHLKVLSREGQFDFPTVSKWRQIMYSGYE
jgi:hypothetical protein